MRTAAAAFLALLLAAAPQARAADCPLTGEKAVLAARLFFGQDIAGRKPLTPTEWSDFLAKKVTPLFPSGFTVYDAAGQWQGAGDHAVTKENTKVIEIEAENTPALRQKLDDIASAYRKQFHQESVGIVTTDACARF